MLYVTRKYGRPNRKERNKTKKRKTITWTCIVCWNGYSTMQRTTFIDWKTIVLSSYWHSWLTISIEEGGFYNGGISFNHLQLLAGWIHGCFRTRFNRLRDHTAWYTEWRSRASFEVQDKEKWTLAPLSVRWQNPIVPATEIRLLASGAKVHRCVCLFTVTGQQKICPEWSGLDS